MWGANIALHAAIIATQDMQNQCYSTQCRKRRRWQVGYRNQGIIIDCQKILLYLIGEISANMTANDMAEWDNFTHTVF